MPAIRPRRSVLYMPGSNARALDKARTLPADTLILDLEDAVAPDAKAIAREQILTAIAEGGYGPRELVVRINALDSSWGEEDLAVMAKSGADAILVPKVYDAEDVFEVGRRLSRYGAPASLSVWVMMETPDAVLNAGEIAAAVSEDAGRRLTAFVIGTNDLAKETRARFVPGRAPMLSWLATFVVAARAHGLDVLDGVYNDISDEAGFIAECEQGRDFGMDGKTLIHPKQVEIANRIFAPAEAEVTWARKIIAAFDLPENASKGVLSLEGKMVERLHAEMAARTVALADAITARA